MIIIRIIRAILHQIVYRLFNFYLINIRVILTKRAQYGSMPSCQQKCYITGKGKVSIGRKCTFGFKLGGYFRHGSIELQPRYENAVIKIGNNVASNNNLCICAANRIEIGNDTLIGQYVCMMDHEGHGIEPDRRRKIGLIGKIVIGDNVWIGNNVTILKNSEIGKNCIIAAGAVVSGVFPDNVIIGGVPAKIIKTIDG